MATPGKGADGPTVKIKLHVDSTKRSSPQWSMPERFYTRVEKKAQEGEVVEPLAMSPGPGAYGRPNINTRFRSVPNVAMTGSVRETSKKYAGADPGPGSYTPFDPRRKKTSYSFGSEARIPKDANAREGHGPADPFKYNKGKKLDAPGKSFLGRGFEGSKRALSTPGPGAYKPNFVQTELAEPKWSPGSGPRSNWQGTNSNPPPWHYKLPRTTMGPQATMPTPATYAFTSRRKPVRADSVPAGYVTFSQFGATS